MAVRQITVKDRIAKLEQKLEYLDSQVKKIAGTLDVGPDLQIILLRHDVLFILSLTFSLNLNLSACHCGVCGQRGIVLPARAG